MEAVFVVAGVEAGGAVTHSTHIQNAQDPEAQDALYARSNLKQLGTLSKIARLVLMAILISVLSQ